MFPPLQSSEYETHRAVQSGNEGEESSSPQSDQDKERNPADELETVGGEGCYLLGFLKPCLSPTATLHIIVQLDYIIFCIFFLMENAHSFVFGLSTAGSPVEYTEVPLGALDIAAADSLTLSPHHGRFNNRNV